MISWRDFLKKAAGAVATAALAPVLVKKASGALEPE